MELQALLVLCGVGVAGLAMLLLMGLFSASGTSYEEAIAQQRRATTELLALAESKNKPKKKEKKANKKLAKKEKSKESSVGMTGSEQESEAPAESGVEDDSVPAPKGHVEFSSAVVVDVPRDTTPNVKIRKRGKDPKVKPILVNKEDPSCVSDPSALPDSTAVTVANHFEEMHPKDEFELMHSTLVAEKVPEKEKVEDAVEKRDTKSVKPAKGAKAVAKPPTPVEVPKEEPARERHNSGESAKEQRKGKKIEKKPAEEVVESPREEVVPPLNAPQPSELTTDKLLKQALANAPVPAPAPASSPPGKNKKKKPEPNVLSLMVAGDSGGVNVGELVRVVREAALSRTEIQILTDALLNKHHDPLPEHSEWTEGPNDPMQKLKKQLADKEKALADEIEASQALHAKLKELRTALNAERTRALGTARAADQAAANARAELHTLQARLQRLHDDNHQLGQEKLMLQSKLAAEAEAQAARVQMELHIQRLSESEAALVAQLTALQGELQAHALEAGQRAMELAAARDAAALAQQHAADLAQQLQDANRALADLDAQRHAAQRAEQRAQQERAQAVAELQNEVQKVASRAQIAENNLELLKEESEKQKQQLTTELASLREQLTTEITSLREQLAVRETELAEIKQLKATPAQNGLPANDQLKAAELAKVESIVESLRDELAAAQRSSRDQRDQVARLQEQLRSYQDKNNELRTKNWKVMEALQSAEKALQMKAASAMPAQDSLREAIAKAEEAQYNEVASVLRKACPSAAPAAGSGRDWLQDFASNLQAQLQRSADSAAQDRLNDLIQQNEQSQSLVEKYKRIIDDTEGVLSRLQQNVTLEEQRWAQQLADKQRELDDLRQRTVMQMQNKIDSLQEELHQAKKSNHNHTFADAERTAEERLMAGLSDKHSVDVSNGPLQVGLEEK